MIFSALNYQMVDLLVERSALMEKDVKGWSRGWKLKSQGLKVPDAMRRHWCFQEVVTCDNEFAARACRI